MTPSRFDPIAKSLFEKGSDPTAVNIFDSILTNQNKGRENVAPAERFLCSRQASHACGRPMAAGQSSAGASLSRLQLFAHCKDV
jgi:hypothetical protein